MKNVFYMKSLYFFTSGIAFLLCLVVISMAFVSCGNSSKKNTSSDDNQMEADLIETGGFDEIVEAPIDIPISITVSNFPKEWKKKWFLGFMVKDEDDNAIYIDTTSPFYNDYVSGRRFQVPCYPFVGDGIESMEYLMLDIDIVNNTSQRIDVNELDFVVESSKMDSLPYLYIITESSISNTISFYNASWINWGGVSFMYSILKKGESFDGIYKEKRHLDYFENDTIIDLLPDLLNMGYDFAKVCINADKEDDEDDKEFNLDQFKERLNLPYVFSKWTNYEKENKYETIIFSYQKDEDSFSPLFIPFETERDEECRLRGIANLYGKIKFDNFNYEVDFTAKIVLSDYGEYGAGSNLDDHFDIELKPQSDNYKLRYPYTTVIESYGAERISLIVKVNKSSNHIFYLNLKNGNGLNIRSKKIHVHYMSPRNYIVNNGEI